MIRLSSCVVLASFLCLSSQFAAATSDPLTSIIDTPGGAGMGFATRMESSPYRGGGVRHDLVPVYLYEGKHIYLHGYRAGLKLYDEQDSRFDVFLSHRFEGFPYDKMPASIAGMAERNPGADFGVSFQRNGAWGSVFTEYLHDISGASGGNELRLCYNYEWQNERWRVRPQLMLAARDSKLNDYYYGV